MRPNQRRKSHFTFGGPPCSNLLYDWTEYVSPDMLLKKDSPIPIYWKLQ